MDDVAMVNLLIATILEPIMVATATLTAFSIVVIIIISIAKLFNPMSS